MLFLFIKISKLDYFEDICLALQSAGISKASSFEAMNLDTLLNDEIPFLRNPFVSDNERQLNQKIVTALIEDRSQAVEAINNLKQSGVDVDNGDILRVMTLPLDSLFDEGTWK